VAKLQQAFAKLARGRCDLVLSNRITGQEVLRQMKLDGIHVVGLALASFPVFHYLNRKHQGLLAALTAALQTMEREHSIARIQAAVLADF
jgi:polar amino acid transport system substrate-binding protein